MMRAIGLVLLLVGAVASSGCAGDDGGGTPHAADPATGGDGATGQITVVEPGDSSNNETTSGNASL